MKKKVASKPERRKVLRWYFLYIAIILIFTMTVLTSIQSILHEQAHLRAMREVGLQAHMELPVLTFSYWININNLLHPSAAGKAVFDPGEREKFLALPRYQQFNILAAGMHQDLILMEVLVLFLLVSVTIPWLLYRSFHYRMPELWQKYHLWINMTVIIWLVAILLSTIANLTTPGGDIVTLAFLH